MNSSPARSAPAIPRERRAELARLLGQFTPNIPALASAYADLRDRAHGHVAQVERLHARGEPATDAVLRGLLPHADTEPNRWRGAWVHVAPTINAELRRWYEAAGWVQPDDWPTVADALWRFVQRCVADPAQLADACRDFSALPYAKGFQSGTLSPILNALRPDEFLLVHSQSLRALGYFTSGKFSSALATYPAANLALQTVVAEAAELADWDEVARPADLFDAFCRWLVAEQKFSFRAARHWLIAVDDGAQWAAWRAGQYAALPGADLGDLGGISRREFEERRDSLMAQTNSALTKRTADLAWRFARQVREGDGVLARKDDVVVGQGAVAGPYFYVDEESTGVTRGHRAPVAWAAVEPRRVEELPGGTFVELRSEQVESLADARVVKGEEIKDWEIGDWAGGETTYAGNLVEVERNSVALAESKVDYGTPRRENPPYLLADLAQDTYLGEATLSRWARAVERKGQAIFHGPPGTGKTFVAERLAQHLAATSEENAGDGFVELVQFHPAYSYEDFVQGLRPNTSEGTLRYDIVPGRFLDFCRRAAACTGRCVLVVDEINRANLSRVFGELMYLLEYRDRAVTLAGSNVPFAIPANVRLLGTMNTADRSIALVDHALRRRFAFIELGPNWEVLRRFHAKGDVEIEPLINVVQRINRAIDEPHYALGHSFFLDGALASTLRDVWEMEIEPYLAEYFFDQPERVDEFRWAAVKRELGAEASSSK